MAISIQTHLNVKDSLKRGRRRFLSSALFAGIASPFYLNSSTWGISFEVRDLLPTVADSLARYRERVDQLPLLFETSLPNSADIQHDFEELINIFRRTKATISNSPHGIVLPDAYSDIIGFLITTGRNSAIHLTSKNATQDSVEADLRSISNIAHFLTTPSCQQTDFAKAFTEASHALIVDLIWESKEALETLADKKSPNDAIKASVLIASQSIALAEKQFKNNAKTDAMTSVVKAKGALLSVERLVVTAYPEMMHYLITTQSLLSGCLTWIGMGGELPDPTKNTAPTNNSHGTSFLASSPSARGAGLWQTVRQVLSEYLPENTTTRVLSCIVLISPILIGYSEQSIRFDLIHKVLPNLFPEGNNDNSENSLKAAAGRLSNVEV